MEKFRLGDIGTIITGNTPKTSDNQNYASSDISFVKPSDIDDNELTDLHSSEYHISEYARDKARILPPQSILVTCIGIVGKVGINAIECAFNQQINAIIPDSRKCNYRYLAYAIQHEKPKLQSIANAPVVPILNKSQFSDIQVPLPPLDEQRKIAAVLDKVNDLIAKRRQQLDKLDELIKARFVEMFGGIHNSLDFPYLPIKDFTSVISGGTPDRNSPRYWNSGEIKWVKTTELQNKVINDTEEKITREGLENSSAKMVPANTILIAMYGQGKTRGMTGYLSVEASTNQACACILPSQKINQKYLWQYMILSYEKLRSLAKGGNQPNLNGAMIKNFPVLVPPIELQNQFAAFVEQTEKTKTAISRSLEKLETLKKALMQEYFG